jgi:hypothetical protein
LSQEAKPLFQETKMVNRLENLNVESVVVPLNALRVESERPAKECRSRRESDRHTRIVLPDGRRMQVSDRFWSSFSSLLNLSRSVFDYFSHEEVFDRITRTRGQSVRVACEITGDAGRMLSCTNPAKPILRVDEVRSLTEEFGGTGISYADGIITSTFECPFPANFQVAGDDFETRFSLQMPVDGYGLPSAFLALLRMVCTNGMIAMSPAFKTAFQLGKENVNLLPLLERAMTTFNNEQGFHALKQRIDSATTSWASLNEAKKLRDCLAMACTGDGLDAKQRSEMLSKFDAACGDPLGIYGLSGHEELSVRRARTIPVEATVYDLFNFASEAGTHHFQNLLSRNRINAWIGDALTAEYDLEGTVENFPDFADYFLSRRTEAPVPAITN